MSERDHSMKLSSQNTWRTWADATHRDREAEGLTPCTSDGRGRKKRELDQPRSFVSGFSLKSFPTVQIAGVLQRNVCHYKESLPTLSFKHNKVEKNVLSPPKHQWEWKCCWALWGVALVYHTTSEAWADRCSRSKTSSSHLKTRTKALSIIPSWICNGGTNVIHGNVQTTVS